MFADQALTRFIAEVNCIAQRPRALDVGSGDGQHSRMMESMGITVIECDLSTGNLYERTAYRAQSFHGIWMSHVLEHALNVHEFLSKVFYELEDAGVLCVTVPPAKHEIVGGHVSLWNAGLLCYRLILAGFDCSEARVGTYGYNISVIVRKKAAVLPSLAMDNGDIERLAPYFPIPFEQNTRGDFGNVRW